MFKLHKPQLSGSIHSGHFMVSRLDDDDEDNNDAADDSSESERDNANSVEIDVNNPDSVVDASNLDMTYGVESASTRNELSNWNDLDRPKKSSHKQNQYLTFYTNTTSATTNVEPGRVGGHRLAASQTSGSGGGTCRSSVSSASLRASSVEPRTGGQASNGRLHQQQQHRNIIGDTFSATAAAAFLEGPQSSLAASSGLLADACPTDFSTIGAATTYNLSQQFANSNLQALQPTQQLAKQHHHSSQHHHHYSSKHVQAAAHGHHAVTIDTSLTKLLECMQLYYSSKLTSPKWKSFKGLKLRLKYKIRLNNLIWRAWFLQCVRGRRPPGCQFTAPIETDVHKKSETIVLEGKYWKRREQAIVDEYKKWRIFHKQKSHIHFFRPTSFDWDSRASNLASSSMYEPEYHFYPDYDMNTNYNLDDLPPMLEELDQREPPESYYPPLLQAQQGVRMVEPAPPQQLPQHLQQHHNHNQHHPHHQQPQQAPLPLQHSQTTHQNHNQLQQQQQQQLGQQQHLLGQIQLSRGGPQGQQQQAISFKTERNNPAQQVSGSASAATTNNNLIQVQQPSNVQVNFAQHQLHQQQLTQQQGAQAIQVSFQRVPTLSFNIANSTNSSIYQQIANEQQQQHLHQIQSQHDELASPLGPLDPHDSMISQDLSSISGGSSSGGSGRNEQRRVCHINAEQKRRCNIKNGFDTLKSILPSTNQNVNVKISKASMLQKAAVYISALSAEQRQLADEQATLRQEIERSKQTIQSYQCQLPESGGPVGRPGSSQARELLQDYIRRRTLDNWKFWIFSLLIEPLFESYYSAVSTNSLEEACKTIFTWLDRSCGLVSLRKDALESLTFLSTSTNILNTPQTLPTESVDAVRYQSQSATSSGSASLPHALIAPTALATAAAAVARQQQQHQQQQQQQQQQQMPQDTSQQMQHSTANAMQTLPIRSNW